MKSVVAIVGRPNVGKSTLFNRLVRERRSITDSTPGVTRDRIYGDVEWTGREFVAVDTGGWEDDKSRLSSGDRQIVASIRNQVEAALETSDAVIFVVDGREGLTGLDQMIGDLLRRRGKPVVLAVNKIDAPRYEMGRSEFYQVGFGEPISIAAEHGRGTGDLLDAVVDALPEEEESVSGPAGDAIKVAIVGRPNVGKSSLLNRVLKDERVLVSDRPGTTRDAVEVDWEWEGQPFTFVDTAGLRKRARIDEKLEWYSVSRALNAVRNSHVVLLMLDAEELVTEQDQRIASYAKRQGRAAVVLVNKWDTVEADDRMWRRYQQELNRRLYFVDYAPSLSISALTGLRVSRIPGLIQMAHENWQTRISTADLNRLVRDVMIRHEAPARKGKKLRVYYATQVTEGPPTFLLFANDPRLVTDNYRRYMERSMRNEMELVGTPLRLFFRKSE